MVQLQDLDNTCSLAIPATPPVPPGLCSRQVGIIPTDSELQMMIEEIDQDQSGDIDMYEFVDAISVGDKSWCGGASSVVRAGEDGRSGW